MERYVDIERFGFGTHDTDNQLHYSEFAYPLRGFDSRELFCTFPVGADEKVGVLCRLERRQGGFDYSQLTEDIQALLDEYEGTDSAPAQA